MRKRYRSDLTDSEWQLIKPLFDWQRRRKYDLRRDILDAMFYLVKTGCRVKGYPSQRMLPREFAPWTTVYYYFILLLPNVEEERSHRATPRPAASCDAGKGRTQPQPFCCDHRHAVGQDHAARSAASMQERKSKEESVILLSTRLDCWSQSWCTEQATTRAKRLLYCLSE